MKYYRNLTVAANLYDSEWSLDSQKEAAGEVSGSINM